MRHVPELELSWLSISPETATWKGNIKGQKSPGMGGKGEMEPAKGGDHQRHDEEGETGDWGKADWSVR